MSKSVAPIINKTRKKMYKITPCKTFASYWVYYIMRPTLSPFCSRRFQSWSLNCWHKIRNNWCDGSSTFLKVSGVQLSLTVKWVTGSTLVFNPWSGVWSSKQTSKRSHHGVFPLDTSFLWLLHTVPQTGTHSVHTMNMQSGADVFLQDCTHGVSSMTQTRMTFSWDL
jgi:hypothetical protein